jgi:hypothetical protein
VASKKPKRKIRRAGERALIAGLEEYGPRAVGIWLLVLIPAGCAAAFAHFILGFSLSLSVGSGAGVGLGALAVAIRELVARRSPPSGR